jgi:hypothetical protein
MSYYDDASLVLIPSGYKNGKVYSQKPTDGTGDLTFSRASSATRVASNGLIEKVRTNVVLRSQEQSDAQYGAVINQITSRVAVANPLTGLNNAYKITSAGGTDPYFGQNISGLSNGENTFSLWLWTDSGQNTAADLIFYNAAASEIYSTSLTITTTPTRYSFTVNFASVGASATVRLDLCQSCGVTYLYTYGWQAESGVMTDYIATTTAAVSVGPVSGLPRLDYYDSTCPKLLLEPQRSNLCLWSENFDNAGWIKNASLVTANDTTSPDGYVNADKLIESSSTNGHFLIQSPTLTAAAYTFSVFAKAGERNWFLFRQHTLGLNASFNLATGTLGTIQSGLTASIEDYGNGWYRCSVTFTGTAAANTLRLYVTTADNNTSSYAGDNTSGLYLYGAQCELGSYQSSYLPTLSTSVTRVADAALKTGISSLIGQTEGTLFVEAEFDYNSTTSSNLICVHEGTSAAAISINRESNNRIQLFVFLSSAVQANIITTANSSGTYKIAATYKQNDFKLYVNGVSIGTDTSGNIPAPSVFGVGNLAGSNIQGNVIKQALIFPTALTATQLAELTA